jgi:hypothetical protein
VRWIVSAHAGSAAPESSDRMRDFKTCPHRPAQADPRVPHAQQALTVLATEDDLDLIRPPEEIVARPWFYPFRPIAEVVDAIGPLDQ